MYKTETRVESEGRLLPGGLQIRAPHQDSNLLNPWRSMVALGLTTWAEQPEPTRSDSHAWSAHTNFDFLTIVAGIRPKAPGFSSVSIEPHLGLLRNVASAMPTPKGMVDVNYVSKFPRAQE